MQSNLPTPAQGSHPGSSNGPMTVSVVKAFTSESHGAWSHVPSAFSTLRRILSLSLRFNSLTLWRLRACYLVDMSFSLDLPGIFLWSDSGYASFSGRLPKYCCVLIASGTICFRFAESLAMKTSIAWWRCIYQATLLPLVINKYFVGRILTLCKYPILHQLSIYYWVYLYLNKVMNIYFIQEVMICCDHYFDVQIVQYMASRSPFSPTLWLLDMSPSFFDHLLAFWHNKTFKAYFIPSLLLEGALGSL